MNMNHKQNVTIAVICPNWWLEQMLPWHMKALYGGGGEGGGGGGVMGLLVLQFEVYNCTYSSFAGLPFYRIIKIS